MQKNRLRTEIGEQEFKKYGDELELEKLDVEKQKYQMI